MSIQRITQIKEHEISHSLTHKTHEGGLYSLHIEDLDFDIDTPKKILFIGGSKTAYCFRRMNVLGGSASVDFYINPTVSDNGNEIDIFNNNSFFVTLEQGLKVYTEPTYSDEGTKCYPTNTAIGTATNQSAAGSSISGTWPRTVPAGTKILGIITAKTNNMMMTYDLDFYEE